jgi:hypothetical protein
LKLFPKKNKLNKEKRKFVSLSLGRLTYKKVTYYAMEYMDARIECWGWGVVIPPPPPIMVTIK